MVDWVNVFRMYVYVSMVSDDAFRHVFDQGDMMSLVEPLCCAQNESTRTLAMTVRRRYHAAKRQQQQDTEWRVHSTTN